jgi:hypothetical protein
MEAPDTAVARHHVLPELIAAVLIAAVVALAGCSGSDPEGAPSTPARTVPTTSTPSAPTTPSTPAPEPSKPRVPHDFVAAAAPTSFRFTGKGYTINATVCGMGYVRPLDPPGEQHRTVCWVQHDFGHAPGTNGRGTTYVLGHAWAEDPLEVLNKISTRAMRQTLQRQAQHVTQLRSGIKTYPVSVLNGDVLTLRTRNGVLNYTVHDAYAVSKAQAGYVRSLMAQNTRHRVVLITCGERHGVDYDYNIIVEAYLTSSRAIPRSRT